MLWRSSRTARSLKSCLFPSSGVEGKEGRREEGGKGGRGKGGRKKRKGKGDRQMTDRQNNIFYKSFMDRGEM